MARYASWVVNVALGALACFLAAQGANSVLAALLTSTPSGDPIPAAPEAPPLGQALTDREIILTRNLFNASTLTPASALALQEEDLEATQLPLTLLGTAAAEQPELSWAAIQDSESQQTLTLRIGDSVLNQAQVPQAQVRRIERKRIVLEENGALRELALEEPADLPTTQPPPPPVRASRVPSRRPMARPLPELASGADEGARSPARLFSEARILPKYDAGQMVGVQVSAIKPGSLFEKMGIEDGDVITELNGIRIDSPEQSAKILLELTRSESFTIQVNGQSGTRTLSAELPEP